MMSDGRNSMTLPAPRRERHGQFSTTANFQQRQENKRTARLASLFALQAFAEICRQAPVDDRSLSDIIMVKGGSGGRMALLQVRALV